jgi:hypothetical protein
MCLVVGRSFAFTLTELRELAALVEDGTFSASGARQVLAEMGTTAASRATWWPAWACSR